MSLVRAVRVILEGLQGLPEAARQEADALLRELESTEAPSAIPPSTNSEPVLETPVESAEPVNPQILIEE